MKVVKNYSPQRPVFFTDKAIKSLGVDAELFTDLETEEEKLKALKNNLDFTVIPHEKTVTRFLDNVEISMLREEYTEEFETVLPVREAEFEAKKAEFKAILKDLAALVAASDTKIRDLVGQINTGTTAVALEKESTYRILHNDKYLFYSIINGHLLLVAVEDVPKNKEEGLFEKQEREKAAAFFNAESNQEQYFNEAS